MQATTYKLITDRIVSLLKKGVVPWARPWAGSENQPRNFVSQKPYRGINSFVLGASAYSSPFWLTFKQANDLCGFIRRGEKATPIIYWRMLEVPDQTEPAGTKTLPLLRYFSVFNLDQTEGIASSKIPVIEKRNHNPIELAEQVIALMPAKPEIRHGGCRAFYSPSNDIIQLPQPEFFKTAAGYYATLMHEAAHSTGHARRLNRKGISGTEGEWSAFGSNAYAKEELVAEMGAAFLCGHCGIINETVNNSASYINSWIKQLQSDERLVVHAAAQAQRAADWVLGVKPASED